MPKPPDQDISHDPDRPPSTPRPSRAGVLRAVHIDLVTAEQDLYDLLHTNRVAVRAPGARQRFARFKIAEVPFGPSVPAATPAAPSTLAPWTP